MTFEATQQLWKKYKVPIAIPNVTDDDISAVVGALKENALSSGEFVDRFEKEFADFVGTKHAVAVNSGTAAIEVSLKTVGVGPRDEVIVPSFTIAATSNAVITLGAKPIFVDIEETSYNLDSNLIEKAITPKTKAIMPIHYAGQCADMRPILEVANKHNIPVVEDAAPAVGALYQGSKAGTFGRTGCFSFFPDKNMTTGEGGMLTTNDQSIAEKAKYLRKHGASSRYYNVEVGWNYKMPDFCAALGSSQLRRLAQVLKRKNEIAQYYSEEFEKTEGILPPSVRESSYHTFTIYPIRTKDESSRQRIRQQLEEKSIETRVNFPPVHLQPVYVDMYKFKRGYLPVTESVGDTVVSLPIFTAMTPDIQDLIIRSVRGAVAES